jgi:hypothetical protein
VTSSSSEERAPTQRLRRRWLWALPVVPAGYAIYGWATLSICARQTDVLAERIRVIYELPRSEHHFPLSYLGEVVREGMAPHEVEAAVRPIRHLVDRISWHTDYGVNRGRWVAQRLLLRTPWCPDYPMDIFFRDGRVRNLDSGYYISVKNQIAADSADRLF